jgi:hypothetical protein
VSKAPEVRRDDHAAVAQTLGAAVQLHDEQRKFYVLAFSNRR